MMSPCVFAASHRARALFFSAGSLLGTFQAGFSLLFGVLDQFFGLREACFAHFLHRGSARALSRQIFLCFSSWANFLVSVRLALLIFCIVDPQGHIFVPAGAARLPTRRQMGSPSRFPPPPGVAFRTTFFYFFVFFGILRFCEN